jgi:hypothetical protein
MRILFGLFILPAFLITSLAGQTRPAITGNFGNVVFPGGTAAQGVQRSFGNVAFPGTGGPKVNIPFSITDPTFASRLGANVGGRNVLRDNGRGVSGRGGFGRTGAVYAFPVYVGGGYYDAPQQMQQQPNITVIYPPQQAPVIINQFGSDNGRVASYGPDAPLPDTVSVYQAPVRSPSENGTGQSMNEPSNGYLIAFKDHTIYSAVAYWVEGDTLHYFTSGNNHNQASITLLDRDLTERLNKERGTEIRLPR